jgi:hypothetical protein
VRYVTEGAPERVSMCHCAWCQKRTGTAFGTEAVFQDAAVRFTKGAPKIYRPFSGVRVDISFAVHAAGCDRHRHS